MINRRSCQGTHEGSLHWDFLRAPSGRSFFHKLRFMEIWIAVVEGLAWPLHFIRGHVVKKLLHVGHLPMILTISLYLVARSCNFHYINILFYFLPNDHPSYVEIQSWTIGSSWVCSLLQGLIFLLRWLFFALVLAIYSSNVTILLFILTGVWLWSYVA